MDDQALHQQIERLVAEEHQLFEKGGTVSSDERTRLGVECRTQNLLRADQMDADIVVAAGEKPREPQALGLCRNPFHLQRCRSASGGSNGDGDQLASLPAMTDAALVLSAFAADGWGSLRSWQLGQTEVLTGVRKSWLRRLAVRCLEWRRFGFGIAVPFQMTRQAAMERRCGRRA